MSTSPIAAVDLAWLEDFQANRIDITQSQRALTKIYAARDMLEQSFDLPLAPWEYVSRPAPEASNLELPALLAHQAE